MKFYISLFRFLSGGFSAGHVARTATLIGVIGLISGCAGPDQPDETLDATVISATVETAVVPEGVHDDAADDPAIWIDRGDPSRSVIVGSNKKAGIHLYDLRGVELDFAAIGDINNVDVRYGFDLNGRNIDIVGGSNRTTNSVNILELKPGSRKLVSLDDGSMVSNTDEVYGFCLYRSKISGAHYAFINGKNGVIEQWRLEASPDDRITGSVVRTLSVESQPEGMVADDVNGILFVGEEGKGVWKFNAEPDAGAEKTFIALSGEENEHIAYDVEGLAILTLNDTLGCLLVSSQGNNSYAIFDRTWKHAYITSFVIGDGEVDGVQETDGLEITNFGLNDDFPGGVFVVQDGFNFDGEEKKPQNFKLVDTRKVLQLVDSSLVYDAGYFPY